MKKVIYPLATRQSGSGETFNPEDCDDILGVMKSLIDGNHPGLLTTVDEKNHPHARWMATFAFEQFPHIYTLTAPDSRKLGHIGRNSHVEWVFSNENLSLVLNLSGEARTLAKAAEIKKIWRMVEDKSHAYFLKNFRERPGFAVVETLVTRVECTIPRFGYRWSVHIEALRPLRRQGSAAKKAAERPKRKSVRQVPKSRKKSG
jgi:general stress protein 26